MPRWVRVRMIGTGVGDDLFRAALPTYDRLIRDDETPLGEGAPRWCIVRVPDEDTAAPEGAETELTVNVPGIGPVIRQLSPTQRARWLARVRAKYRENAAAYELDPQ
jgi:hypothetical protein